MPRCPSNGDLLVGWQAVGAGDAVEALMALAASNLVLQDPTSDFHMDGVDRGISRPTGFPVADIGHHAGGAPRDVLIHNARTGVIGIGLVSGGHISDWTAIDGATAASFRRHD